MLQRKGNIEDEGREGKRKRKRGKAMIREMDRESERRFGGDKNKPLAL